MLKKGIKKLLLVAMLLTCNMAAWADDEVFSYEGDHYVINVEALHPDSEMTLMDVLLVCPDFITTDGRNLVGKYELCVDNVAHNMDVETFFQNVKASELKEVHVYNFGSVSQGSNGLYGVVDVFYKTPTSPGTSGKVAIEGSTYGNGKLYTDVTTSSENVVVKGYALTSLKYGKATTDEVDYFRSRRVVENAHFSLKWDISPKDNLMIKAYQQFYDYKERSHIIEDDENSTIPILERYVDFVAKYSRILNDNGAEFCAEACGDYLNLHEGELKIRDTYPYFYAEFSSPLFTEDLQMMVGWEIDYDNYWVIDYNRQQYLENQFYMQLNYSHGPWNITIGDRFNHFNHWSHSFNPGDDEFRTSNSKNINCFQASVGYKVNRHLIQGSFSHDFYLPTADEIYLDISALEKRKFYPKTNTIWNTEAMYTYQHKNIMSSSSVYYSWMDDSYLPKEQKVGFRTSLTWRAGILRLTAGADYYHINTELGGLDTNIRNNCINLKLAPTLLLGHGFRISSVLLYNNKQSLSLNPSHLYASVKVNKDFGKYLNVYADFRDIAGMPSFPILNLQENYYNRALTIGMTYRF